MPNVSSAIPSYSGLRVVVTGGAGFIGSHLVDALLAAGAEQVAVVDNFFLGREQNLDAARSEHPERLRIFREDAGELAAMAAVVDAVRPDLVFNLATKALPYSFFNPSGAYRVNIDIAIALAELLRNGAYGKLIHLSSSEVYGTARTVPMSEEHPYVSETSYAAGKAAADLLMGAYVRMYDLDVTTLRPFNNYGPRQNDGDYSAVIPITIRRLERGERPVLFGDGLQTRDFIFVRDTVHAILRFGRMDGTRGEVINLGSGQETTIRRIIEQLCAAFGYDGPLDERPPRPADVRRHCADTTKARSLLGDLPLTDLAQGIAETVQWYREARP